jgi:enoyl-CoA hydratase
MAELVGYTVKENVACLHMDDGKANAYGPSMIAALSSALDRAASEARATVIEGRAGVLCAGFDLKIIRGDDAAARDAMRQAGRELLCKSYLHPHPLVLACTGHALAAGALLLLTGDYRIGVHGEFKIGLNETSIGLSLPAFGLELARDRLHPQFLSAATVLGTVYTPEQALAAGYLDHLVSVDVLTSTAFDRARMLSALDADAVAATKRRLRQATMARAEAVTD